MAEIQFTVAGNTRTPVTITDEEIAHFIRGEVPPIVADRFVEAGMPRRGVVRFTIRHQKGNKVQVIGPSLARRAGTLSSAL